jgi:hypothetical protein
MKKIILCILFFLATLPAYAVMNMEAFYGTAFGGSFASLDATEDISGSNYGFRVNALYRLTHADLGLGTFFQSTPMEYTSNGNHYELNKLSLGLDSFVRYKNDSWLILPYVRFGLALYDKTEQRFIEEENISISEKRFKAGYGGFGVSYPLVPMPVIDVNAFLEYLYDYSRIDQNSTVKTHKINFGIFMAL